MIRYRKTAQSAISAISMLAEVYADGRQLSSREIAISRELPQTLVAKLLSMLSHAGLISGTRGPGGGYSLARSPSSISLAEVVSIFERPGGKILCPFGPNWCGNGDPCPLHDTYTQLSQQFDDWLRDTSLEVFCSKSVPATDTEGVAGRLGNGSPC